MRDSRTRHCRDRAGGGRAVATKVKRNRLNAEDWVTSSPSCGGWSERGNGGKVAASCFRAFLVFVISSSTSFISSWISPSAASRASTNSLYLKKRTEFRYIGVWAVRGGWRLAPEKEKEGDCSVMRYLAGEEERGGVAEDDGEDGHEGEGADSAGEHDVGAALHGEQRSDEEGLVADFADEDGAEALQEGVRSRREPGRWMLQKFSGGSEPAGAAQTVGTIARTCIACTRG